MTKLNLVFVVATFLLSACGLQQKAADMQSTSDQIHGDTARMADGMAATKRGLSMAESFKFTKELIDEMYRDSNASAGNADNESLRVANAGAIIKALYFQFWDGGFKESVPELDNRLYLSLEWLITQMKQYIPHDGQINHLLSTLDTDHMIDDLNPNGIYKASASIAAELDQVQPGFQDALAGAGLNPNMSLYNVIVDSLHQCFAPDAAYQFPRSRRMVCQFKSEFIFLLQLRQNYLPMLMFSQSTNFSALGDARRAAMLVTGATIDVNARWVTPYALQLWSGWLKAAQQTREDLLSLCEPLQINWAFNKLVDGLKIPVQMHAQEATGGSFLDSTRAEFEQALTTVQSSDSLKPLNQRCGQ